jgi:hypothetical protein
MAAWHYDIASILAVSTVTVRRSPPSDRRLMARPNFLADGAVGGLRRSAAVGMQRLGFDTAIIDRCLNHVAIRGVGATYMRHQYLAERRAAMLAWAKHVVSTVEN